MMRLSVVVLDRDERKVLRELGRLGAVHLVRLGPGPDTAPLAAHDRTAELTHCDNLLNRIESLRQRLELGALPESALEPVDLPLGSAEGSLRPLEERTSAAIERQEDLRRRLAEASATWRQAGPFRKLDVPLDLLGGSAFLHFAIGTLPAENLPPLRARVGLNVVLAPLAEHEGRRPLIAITSLPSREPLEAALKDLGFTRETFCAEEGASAKSLADESQSELEFLRGQVEDARTQVAALGREVAQPLADLKSLLAMERALWEAEQHFPRTQATALLAGWVPAVDLPLIRQHVHEVTGGRSILQAVAPEDVPEEEVPVLLRHSRFLRPFVMLLENYGLPTYREIEPTVFMAVSYLVMFGMMFGDAGNGAVVAAGGVYLLRKGRTVVYRDAGLLLLMAGLASVASGIYFGSYFGITEIGGQRLGHDPLGGSPVTLMLMAVGIGVVLMSLGLVLNIINRIAHGDWITALLDKFGLAGVVFYWGMLAVLLAMKFTDLRQWPHAGLLVLLAAVVPLTVVALKAPIQFFLARRSGLRPGEAGLRPGEAGHGVHGSLGESLIESAIEVFDAVIGYLANTVSFVRLAAYAMSHAAVLFASVVIAKRLMAAWPGAGGIVVGIIVVVLGNGVAILLEGIVASVQALRLEYYEFFGKFFSGSGQAFKPFRLAVTE
jgi:V/A-type H+-transporting ATPase subunit I